MKALTPKHTKEFIINALMMREIPYISGPPGIGKSDIVAQVADEFNLLLIDERLSQKLPEDLSGLPSLDAETNKATYNPFDTFPMKGDPIPDGYSGWLIFLDELSSATEEVMAAIYSLLLGHRVGGKEVHPKALIVAAGNRSTDSAIARPLPDTLITRMLPCEMKVSSKDWLSWATEPTTDSNETVIDFIKKYPDMLLGTVDPSKRAELETYPTPRGWNRMFKIVKLHEKQTAKSKKPAKDAAGIPMAHQSTGAVITPGIMALMTASVGVMAAKAFQEHYDETMQLPYPWEVAQSPASTRIPSTTMGRAKLTADLAEHFVDSQEQSRDSILQFINRMDKECAALFTQILSESLGQTQSDLKMISDIKKRLSVTDINVSDVNKGGLGDDPDNVPF